MAELYGLNLVSRSILVKPSIVDRAYSTASSARRLGLLVWLFYMLLYPPFFSLHIPKRVTTNGTHEPPAHNRANLQGVEICFTGTHNEWVLSMPQRFRDCIEKGQLIGH